MLLTGKAEKDFYSYVFNKYNLQPYNLFNNIFSLSIIVEWFENQEYMGERFFSFTFKYFYQYNTYFMSFNDIVKQTIEKCNEIYNNLNK